MTKDYEEKTMRNGEVMTLAEGPAGWWDLDRWRTDGDNRWHRRYASYAEAKAEYDRWN